MHAEVTLEWSGVGWSGARYSSAVAPVTDLMVKSAPCESSSETHESMPLSAANISGVTSLLLSADRSTQFVGARVCAATAHRRVCLCECVCARDQLLALLQQFPLDSRVAAQWPVARAALFASMRCAEWASLREGVCAAPTRNGRKRGCTARPQLDFGVEGKRRSGRFGPETAVS